jgi:hypothetical protein
MHHFACDGRSGKYGGSNRFRRCNRLKEMQLDVIAFLP